RSKPTTGPRGNRPHHSDHSGHTLRAGEVHALPVWADLARTADHHRLPATSRGRPPAPGAEVAQCTAGSADEPSEPVPTDSPAGAPRVATGPSASATSAALQNRFRADARHDAASTAAAGRTAMRRSLTGPLVLITIGLLFLFNNLNPGFSIGAFISQYWPFLLIGAGVIGLIEVLANASRGYDPNRRGFRLAWIFWPVLLFGVLSWHGRAHMPLLNWGRGGVGIFGAEYEYDVNASAPSTGVTRIVLDSTRGSLNVKGDGDG